MVRNTKNNELLEKFNKECKVIDFNQEYEGYYTGKEKYAIATDLTDDELNEKYSEIISGLKPYMLCSKDFGEAIGDFQKNESKYEKRYSRSYSLSADSEEIEKHPEFWAQDVLDKVTEYDTKKIEEALKSLSDFQKKTIILRIIEEKTYCEIAEELGKSTTTIAIAFYRGIKNIRKFLGIREEIK